MSSTMIRFLCLAYRRKICPQNPFSLWVYRPHRIPKGNDQTTHQVVVAEGIHPLSIVDYISMDVSSTYSIIAKRPLLNSLRPTLSTYNLRI